MSDIPNGPGWWQASDDRWYPPETHPDYRAPAVPVTAGLADFEPPRIEQRYPTPNMVPPAGPLPGDGPLSGDAIPGGGAPAHHRVPAPGKRRNTKIIVIVFSVAFLAFAGGCGAFIYSFRDEIADATIDFSDSVVAEDEATCDVVDVEFGGNYGVEVTLEAAEDAVASHYQVTFEILTADGELLGAEKTVLRSVGPGELRTENAFNSIVASNDFETVLCEVNGVRRVTVE